MKYSLLKSQHHVDPAQVVRSDQWLPVQFHQVSTFCPDDHRMADQLPNTGFVISEGGILHATFGYRFIQQPAYRGTVTVVPRIRITHPKYKGPKKIGQHRVVANGPCDGMLVSMPFRVEDDTRIWVDLWQHNANMHPYQIEIAYLSVEVL